MSWPASSARSSWGITVLSNPCRPGQGSRPSRRAARRLSRNSWRNDFWTWPEARSSATMVTAGGEVRLTSADYSADPDPDRAGESLGIAGTGRDGDPDAHPGPVVEAVHQAIAAVEADRGLGQPDGFRAHG